VEQLKDQHVLVLGLGASGLAMARWCARCGARVTVADTREAPPQLPALRSELPGVNFVAGPFELSLVQGSDVRAVFKSPGLTPASVAPLWSSAQGMGLWMGTELDLFARALADLRASRAYGPKVLAVTGTNGKTTVTSLTGQLVERAGKRVAVAGNIGPTLLDTLADRLAAGDLPEVWVLELSSFQLDGVREFEPTAAVVLNLTQDHLDWHGSMEAYAAAKARIFGQTGLMVLNREDPAVMAMLPPPGKGKAFRAGETREHVSFGADLPPRPGDFGIEQVKGMAWLVRAQEADETRRKRKGDEEEELVIQRLMPADALRIRGRHNATNALAALALAQAAGCGLGPILYGLREYRGEPHRVESVGMVRGVEYFDDSKGTNVGATAGRSRGAARARGGPDRPGCSAHSNGAASLWREPVEGRVDGPGRDAGQPASPSGRRGADVAGLCQLRHVRQLRAPRAGLSRSRRGIGARRRGSGGRGGNIMSAAGPSQGARAPSGGSAAHEVASVGATS
jgi:UDP-N-acetylmuramoylalanine--D-glutamate ligase